MGDIRAAIDAAKASTSTPCVAGQWLDTLSPDDRSALNAFAAQKMHASYLIARQHGATVARSTWTLHHHGQCGCKKDES